MYVVEHKESTTVVAITYCDVMTLLHLDFLHVTALHRTSRQLDQRRRLHLEAQGAAEAAASRGRCVRRREAGQPRENRLEDDLTRRRGCRRWTRRPPSRRSTWRRRPTRRRPRSRSQLAGCGASGAPSKSRSRRSCRRRGAPSEPPARELIDNPTRAGWARRSHCPRRRAPPPTRARWWTGRRTAR